MNRRFISVREASEFCGVSASSVRLRISQGRLRSARAGGRVLIDREHLERRAAGGQLLGLLCQSERPPTRTDGGYGRPMLRIRPTKLRCQRHPRYNGRASLNVGRKELCGQN
jgi:excisionase family DNA binding protein